MNEHLFILGTVLCTVFGQILLKWRIAIYGSLPAGVEGKIIFLFKMVLDPFIIFGFFSAFLAALCWMAAMTKFDLSYAYPFVGLTYVLNLFFAVMLLNEAWTWPKLCGTGLIVLGIYISSRSI